MPKGIPKSGINKGWIKKGSKLSEETKRKISLNGFHYGMKGKKHSIGTRKKMSEAQKGEKNPFWGKKHTEETKKKIGEESKRRKHSKETRRKMSEARKGEKAPMFGKRHSEKTKKKMRESAFEYAKKMFDFIYPRIGKNEKQILDKLERELKYRIIRQYEIGRYYLDGYIPEINLVIEVDEKYHNNKKKKDIEREEFIKQKLGCKFLRIKDYD